MHPALTAGRREALPHPGEGLAASGGGTGVVLRHGTGADDDAG